MAILNLIIFVALIVFIISSFVGLVRFWRDTKKVQLLLSRVKRLKRESRKAIG